MNIKNKKGMEGGLWMIVAAAIVALIVGGIIIFIVKGGLSTGKSNVDLLSSCGNQGGTCKSDCGTNERGFFKYGCPDEDGSGKVEPERGESESNKLCCILK